ncbi:MAG: multicopper oxidase domain-containing protein [Acidobacteria bacterium]|nr:multicopper oxidase domain-containing protein [Acidobacteriota bacterium]
MQGRGIHKAMLLLVAGLVMGSLPSFAAIFVQCPGDTNHNAQLDPGEIWPANQKCMHLSAGDGFISMADGHLQYTFGFSDMTGIAENQVANKGLVAANFPAPTIAVDEGDTLYLSLSNVGMVFRPDLFDPHSVHWHGFPDASAIFDGVPDSSATINMGSTFTYFYNVVEPGTYMYHCHVEATEHMQMGMLGNLYVRPQQNGTSAGTCAGGSPCTTFAYNDVNGSTGYDVEFPIQLASFDSYYHDEHLAVQPLPFYAMKDDYAMLNGRGYPDTVVAGALPPPLDENGDPANATAYNPAGTQSQKIDSIITATAGQKVLLRLSNLSVTRFFSIGALGLPFKVVGWNARILRGPDPDGAGPLLGKDLTYDTVSVTLGGGESADVIVDTAGVAPGKYFLYAMDLNYLSNREDDFGGMMTEIVIN